MNHALPAVCALWKREVLRFVRQRSRWIGALVTPLFFWILVGSGLGRTFQDPSGSVGGYLTYLFPGSIALSVLFTAIFSTISVIEDRHQGFLQGVLVAPVPRWTVVMAKVLGGASLGLLQGALFLVAAPFLGVHLDLVRLLLILVLIFAMAGSLTSLGFFFAWKIDSSQGYHGIMNLVLMPMWLLSGSVFPASNDVFRLIFRLNPLSYAMDAFKALLWQLDPAWNEFGLAIGVLLAFLACFAGISTWLVSRSGVPLSSR